MIITKTEITSDKVSREYTLAVCSDLHNRKGDNIISALAEINPDLILIPGDLMHNLDYADSLTRSKNGLKFLRRAALIAPTFYSLGNHEHEAHRLCKKWINQTGARLLDDEAVKFGEFGICGISPRGICTRFGKTPKPDIKAPAKLEKLRGFRIALSHHPEHYEPYLRERNIDLVISGHAHGGQWNFFGHGIFAPGQGLFPKYTSGLYDGRLFVSRGLTNTAFPIPRWGNPPELATIIIKPK